MADFAGPDPTEDELATRKGMTDRAVLLDHVDELLRPPPWVYKEIEIAIQHAINGELEATVQSREGHYLVSDLVERWELEEVLDAYRRDPSDPSYEPAGRHHGWPDVPWSPSPF